MENLLIDILEITLPISAWIALLLLCAPILKRSYVSKWRYYMWLFVSIRLVLPFKLSVAEPVTMSIPREIPAVPHTIEQTSAVITLPQLLTLIWLAGMIIFLLYQAACYLSFSGAVRRWAKPVTDERILTAAQNAKEFTGVKRNFKIKLCKAISTPMVFGIIKPVLLLPYVEFTDAELSIVLRHELVHLKRRDIWYKLLVMAARAVHWFNPIVHIMARAADRDMEFACDAEVVKSQNAVYRRSYCEAIMRLVHNGRGRGTALSTCFFFSKKTVLERFKGILDEKIKRSGVLMFCVIAVSVTVSGGVITFATDSVAEVIEEDLQIIERPTPKPSYAEPAVIPTEEPKPEIADDAYTADDVYTAYTEDYSNYTEPDYDYYDDDTEDYGYADDSDFVDAEEQADEIAIGNERSSVYNQLGTPDSVSGDGSRETYTLPDGNTAILQYNGDVLDEGYIIVE